MLIYGAFVQCFDFDFGIGGYDIIDETNETKWNTKLRELPAKVQHIKPIIPLPHL